MPSLPRLSHLPLWLSHWLGYRSRPPKIPSAYTVYLWSFIGAFCGLSVLQAIFGHAQYFIDHHVPSIIVPYVRTHLSLPLVPSSDHGHVHR